MEELEAIWNMRSCERSRSYTRNLAAVFQPCSYSEFNAHPDFDEAFQRWTQNDRHRGLDVARVWSFVLNLKDTLSRCAGSVAEIGVYQGQSSANTFSPPPAGFDPATASPLAFQAYGLPSMPDKRANPQAYTSWLNAVSIPNRINPVLEKTNIFHGPHRAAPKSAPLPEGAARQSAETPVQAVLASYDWSGFSIYDPSAPFKIEQVWGSYVVPVARNPFGQCPSHPQYDVWSSYWVGIDGLTNAVVFQNGVEADSYNDCAGRYQYYAPWLEWFPGPEYRVLNAPVQAGDYIVVVNWTTSTTTGCFFWANESQQSSGSVCTSAGAVGGSAVQGSSVEWITERPYTGEHARGFAYLTNYVTAPWWQSFAFNYAAGNPTVYYAGSAPTGTLYQIYAVDDNGGLISYPYLAGFPDAIFFYNYGSAYCYPGASCTARY
jgi:hypothetical protein